MTIMINLFISITYLLLSLLTGAYGEIPPEPAIVDYSQTNGRIYLDAAIDKNQNIHLIWMSIKPLQYHQTIEKTSPLYYQKGEELGKVWSKPLPFLTNKEYPLDRQYPRVIAAGDHVEVFWSLDGLHYKLSSDGGTTWGPEKRALPEMTTSYSVVAQLDTLYIVFSTIDSTFFSKSTDFGSTWAPLDTIAPSMSSLADWSPLAMTIKDGNLHIVGEPENQRESNASYRPWIYYIRGRNFGKDWDKPRIIDLTKGRSRTHFIARANDVKILSYDDKIFISYKEKGLSYIESSDGGDSWSNPKYLPAVPDVMRYDICSGAGDKALVFWIDFRNMNPYLENNDIFFTTVGRTIGQTIRLTPELSYAEIYYDAIFCGSVGDNTVVIWGGKRDIGENALDDSTRSSEIFVRLLTSRD